MVVLNGGLLTNRWIEGTTIPTRKKRGMQIFQSLFRIRVGFSRNLEKE